VSKGQFRFSYFTPDYESTVTFYRDGLELPHPGLPGFSPRPSHPQVHGYRLTGPCHAPHTSYALIVETKEGLVIVSGCGHAGIVNTCEYARALTGQPRILAAIGGFHLFPATDEQIEWTARKLRGFGLEYLLGAHCTGLEAVYRIRKIARLDRATAVVGAVGSSFTLGRGIDPLRVAR
jgi:hypothetical protein